jgi:trehalose 6-phosphate phosphatase
VSGPPRPTSADPIAELASEPGRAALFLDIDGVLAPIVPQPEDARVPPETRAELARLAGRYALVACVTGRVGEDARRLVSVDGVTVVGEHGLELVPEAEAWVEPLARFGEAAPWPAERKRLTLAFHWRTAPDEEEALAVLRPLAEQAEREGFRPRWGRKVLEVRPPLDADKGTAVRALLERHGLRRALYAGDDTTDLDAFRALDGLELPVRIAVASAEGPRELREAADMVVDGPAEVLALLRRL